MARPTKRKSYFGRSSTASSKKTKVVKYAPYKAPRYTGIRKIVRDEIQNAAEKKVWISYAANIACPTASNSVPTWVNLIPTLSQGTGQSARIGNQIRVTKGMVDITVNLLPYNSTTNPLSTPVEGRLFLGYPSKVVTTNLGTTNIATEFFEINNGTAGWQANMLDMVLTPQKDSWVVLQEKRFRLGATYASTGGAVGTSGYFDNSEMSRTFSFDFGKYVSTLRYDDAVSTQATNKSLFVWVQLVYSDGSLSSLIAGEWHYNVRVEYTDL